MVIVVDSESRPVFEGRTDHVMNPTGQKPIMLIGGVGDVPHRIQHPDVPPSRPWVPLSVELGGSNSDAWDEPDLRVEVVLEVDVFAVEM